MSLIVDKERAGVSSRSVETGDSTAGRWGSPGHLGGNVPNSCVVLTGRLESCLAAIPPSEKLVILA